MAVDQFCLKWNNFQKSIISAFESLQVTEDLADVTLTCEGISVKAHKIILSACSPYFRTVFKENPCPHPIVILKDVLYADLLAILNFMYHGEVLVSKDQLKSFLQTAEILRVSGLNSYGDFCGDTQVRNTQKVHKSHKSDENSSAKKSKLSPKRKKTASFTENVQSSTSDEKSGMVTENFELVEMDKIKMETSDEDCSGDPIENIDKGRKLPSSILEAALEVKDEGSPSILERSLMCAGKSPNFLPPDDFLQTTHDTQKNVFGVPKKDLDKMKQPQTEPELVITAQRVQDVTDTCVELITEPTIQIQAHHSSQCGSCPHCGKVYSNQSALKYHVRLVHSDLTNMYCCHLCPESFDYREGFKKHMADAHSVRN